MPPKKKKASKKKAAGDASSNELTPADKLIRAAMEMDALQRELAIKNDINARLKSQIMDSRGKMAVLEDSLKIKTNDQLELTSDMARQYKSMQSELLETVNRLDAENKSLETKISMHSRFYKIYTNQNLYIDTLQTNAKDQKKKYDTIIAEKDALIEEQNSKMTYMTNEFEHMLNVIMIIL